MSLNVVAVFENPTQDQSNNAAEGEDEDSDDGGFMNPNRQGDFTSHQLNASGSSIDSQHGRSAVRALASPSNGDVASFRRGVDESPPRESNEEDPEESRLC